MHIENSIERKMQMQEPKTYMKSRRVDKFQAIELMVTALSTMKDTDKNYKVLYDLIEDFTELQAVDLRFTESFTVNKENSVISQRKKLCFKMKSNVGRYVSPVPVNIVMVNNYHRVAENWSHVFVTVGAYEEE